ncbi:unnamed protein product [Brassica rapa subsp. trilocularis]
MIPLFYLLIRNPAVALPPSRCGTQTTRISICLCVPLSTLMSDS